MNRTHAKGRGLALALALGAATPAMTQAGQPRPFAPLPALTVAEMASLRGGLKVAGLDLDLTAELRTYVDHQLALATQYRLTRLEEGRRMVQTRVRQGRQHLNSRLEAAFGAEAGDAASGPPATPPSAIRTATATDGGIGRGTVTVTDTGVTTITHSIGPKRVVSTIANTADGRHFRQEIHLEATVHNFRELSSRIRSALDARRLGRAASGGVF